MAQTHENCELAVTTEEYEDTRYPLPMPKSIPEMVELKRFQLKLTQAALGDMLGFGKPKLSQILDRKRKPAVSFLKAVDQKLGIDPVFYSIMPDNVTAPKAAKPTYHNALCYPRHNTVPAG